MSAQSFSSFFVGTSSEDLGLLADLTSLFDIKAVFEIIIARSGFRRYVHSAYITFKVKGRKKGKVEIDRLIKPIAHTFLKAGLEGLAGRVENSVTPKKSVYNYLTLKKDQSSGKEVDVILSLEDTTPKNEEERSERTKRVLKLFGLDEVYEPLAVRRGQLDVDKFNSLVSLFFKSVYALSPSKDRVDFLVDYGKSNLLVYMKSEEGDYPIGLTLFSETGYENTSMGKKVLTREALSKYRRLSEFTRAKTFIGFKVPVFKFSVIQGELPFDIEDRVIRQGYGMKNKDTYYEAIVFEADVASTEPVVLLLEARYALSLKPVYLVNEEVNKLGLSTNGYLDVKLPPVVVYREDLLRINKASAYVDKKDVNNKYGYERFAYFDYLLFIGDKKEENSFTVKSDGSYMGEQKEYYEKGLLGRSVKAHRDLVESVSGLTSLIVLGDSDSSKPLPGPEYVVGEKGVSFEIGDIAQLCLMGKAILPKELFSSYPIFSNSEKIVSDIAERMPSEGKSKKVISRDNICRFVDFSLVFSGKLFTKRSLISKSYNNLKAFDTIVWKLIEDKDLDKNDRLRLLGFGDFVTIYLMRETWCYMIETLSKYDFGERSLLLGKDPFSLYLLHKGLPGEEFVKVIFIQEQEEVKDNDKPYYAKTKLLGVDFEIERRLGSVVLEASFVPLVKTREKSGLGKIEVRVANGFYIKSNRGMRMKPAFE